MKELQRGGLIDPTLVHDTAIAQRFRGEHVIGHEENDALGNFFLPGSPIRPLAHTTELELMSALVPTNDPRRQIFLAHRHGLVPSLEPSDWDWLFRDFSCATDQKRRAHLFYALLDILRTDTVDARFDALRAAAADVPKFVSLLEFLKAPPPLPDPA